jgi:hypothetical protein
MKSKITVDYTRSAHSLIVDGHYTWKDYRLNGLRFPSSSEMEGKVDVTVKLFHFDWYIKLEHVASEMDKAGYRPATLIELLTLGILFPNLQKKFSIAATGSFWDDDSGDRLFPFLSAKGSDRILYASCKSDINVDNRFMGIKK